MAMDCKALERELMAREGRWQGKELPFLCPCHADHHPSARWNPEKQCWYCFVCGIGGGYKDLAKRLNLCEALGLHVRELFYDSALTSSQRRTLPPRPRRFDWRRMSHDMEFASESHWLRAESIFKAARQCDVSDMNDEDLDQAWRCLGIAFHSLRVSENLGIIAFQIRVNGLADEARRHRERKAKAA